jgi:hypothetical protein
VQRVVGMPVRIQKVLREATLQGVAVVGTILAAVIALDAPKQRDYNYKQDPRTRAATPYSDAEEMVVSYLPANTQGYAVELVRAVAWRNERSAGCEGRYSPAAGILTSYSSR